MTSYSTTCAICLEDTLEVHTITLDCKHPFHAPCLSQLRTNKCPTCRRRFTNIHPEMLSKIKQREHDDVLSRNAEDLNELWSNLISAGDGGPPPPVPPPPFAEFAGGPGPLAYFTISLIRSIPPRYPISVLLNTQVQGVTLQTMLETYIVRNFTA